MWHLIEEAKHSEFADRKIKLQDMMQRHLKLLTNILEQTNVGQLQNWTKALISEAASNYEDEIIFWTPKPKKPQDYARADTGVKTISMETHEDYADFTRK